MSTSHFFARKLLFRVCSNICRYERPTLLHSRAFCSAKPASLSSRALGCVNGFLRSSTEVKPRGSLRLTHSRARNDPELAAEPLRATDVQKNVGKRWVDVTWNDDSVTSYPYVWLRDNCQCSKCFHPTTKSRQVLMMDLDPKIEPKQVQVIDDGSLKVTWPDGHESPYPSEWLHERAFTDAARRKRNEVYGQKHKFWGAELQDKIPTYDFSKICSDENHLLDWLLGMELHGIALIRNAPQRTGELEKIAQQICFTRRTNYGESFQVESKTDPSNLAYTNVKLGLHCDLPFYYYVPGLQFLHCVVNSSTGGSNVFADASYAAKIMETEYPEMYEILSTRLVDYYDIGTDAYTFHKVARWPNFVRDNEGNVKGVCYNNQVRDTFMNLPIEDVQPLYEALRKFDDIMYDPNNHVKHTLKAGDIICFDNIRVLHGREEYDIGSDGHRHLEGIYIDWDEVQSRIRVLKSELNRTNSS
ncbi:gamma-butyrobetaine dioxygenase-like [Tubulanus polymorphus]|uniref:gamma-butyrobetaine dioxygenase-like n=1 Tax=Tubulanus polymorphus TaxID=672921 RepID=UPI003DA25C3C